MINSSDVLIVYLCLLFQISISVRITWLNIPDFTELLTSSSFPNGFSTPPFPVLPRLIIQDFIPTLRYDEWHVYFISLSCACLNRLYIVVDLRRKKLMWNKKIFRHMFIPLLFAVHESILATGHYFLYSIKKIWILNISNDFSRRNSCNNSGLTVIWVGCF